MTPGPFRAPEPDEGDALQDVFAALAIMMFVIGAGWFLIGWRILG